MRSQIVNETTRLELGVPHVETRATRGQDIQPFIPPFVQMEFRKIETFNDTLEDLDLVYKGDKQKREWERYKDYGPRVECCTDSSSLIFAPVRASDPSPVRVVKYVEDLRVDCEYRGF